MSKMNLMNGKDLRKELNISTTVFYKFKKAGMPYHQLPGGRAYYLIDEIEEWLYKDGYHQEKTWTK